MIKRISQATAVLSVSDGGVTTATPSCHDSHDSRVEETSPVDGQTESNACIVQLDLVLQRGSPVGTRPVQLSHSRVRRSLSPNEWEDEELLSACYYSEHCPKVMGIDDPH